MSGHAAAFATVNAALVKSITPVLAAITRTRCECIVDAIAKRWIGLVVTVWIAPCWQLAFHNLPLTLTSQTEFGAHVLTNPFVQVLGQKAKRVASNFQILCAYLLATRLVEYLEFNQTSFI